MTGARTDRLMAGLTPLQRGAVESDDAPLCVLAGAGSGKTTVLTRRVARRVLEGLADAEHVLVATFTRKAAGELRARLRRLDVPGRIWAGTFHAAAFAQLRRHRADRGLRPLCLLDDPVRLVRDTPVGPGVLERDAVAAVVGEVQWAQSRLVGPDDYVTVARAERRRLPLPAGDVAECFAYYVEAKRARGLVDLGDLLVDCTRLYEEDATAAAAMRWRVRHLFVDEFQDVNPAQYRLLRGWLGDRRDLFVVGDPRQAVYGWNGADPTLLDRIGDVLPGTTVLHLDENHRSTPQVVAAARTVLAAGTGAVAGPTASEATPEGPEPVVAGFDDEEAEARAVARWLRLAHRPGRTWSHVAVLARTNRRLDAMADTFEALGIPHHRAAGPVPAGVHIGAVIRALRRIPAGAALRPALTDATEATGPDAHVPAALRRLADEYALEEPEPGVGGFLAWLAATVGTQWDEPDDQARGHVAGGSVTLSTFHRAKGLEWPVVAVIGLEDGLVPIAYVSTPPALDEERRLLYVAMTRAERELWCSWATNRVIGGQRRACDPSPYLAGLGSARRLSMAAADVSARLAELRAAAAAVG